MTLQARFSLRRGDFRLEVDLEAPSRGVTGLFGPSGAGKTLLLRSIAGLETIPGGFVRMGETIWQDSERTVPTHRRELGYVFQEAGLFQHLTVRGNLDYAQRRIRNASRTIDREVAVGLLGLERLLDRRPARLSGGERQRVAIARALLTAPRLLLMDEPLASLDLAGRAEILPFLETLHRELEIPILYVSHAADEVARLADHLILLEGGRITASGPIAAVLSRVDLPMARGDDAAALVEAVVAGHDAENSLTLLDFPGGRFTVFSIDLPVGTPVRVRVLARDVSLTLERQVGTSILNIFPARVEKIVDLAPSQALVRLDLAGVRLISKITRKSSAALGLVPGKKIYAQIKAVALLR